MLVYKTYVSVHCQSILLEVVWLNKILPILVDMKNLILITIFCSFAITAASFSHPLLGRRTAYRPLKRSADKFLRIDYNRECSASYFGWLRQLALPVHTHLLPKVNTREVQCRFILVS